MRSRGTTSSCRASWTLYGAGEAMVRVGSCRVGWITHRVEVP
jgi:hypothetical protein